MSESDRKIVIVGAGTSGIATAVQLAEFGIPSIVLDESPRIGGVVFRGPFRESIHLPHFDAKLSQQISDIRASYYKHQSLIELRTSSVVLGPSGKESLVVKNHDVVYELKYSSLVIATGCHERSVPFPGWQLPGVMLMGGVQLQIKSGLVKPGSRMAVIGTGPLLPLIAVQLHKAGIEVVGVYEAGKLNQFAQETMQFLNRPQLVLEGIGLLSYLKKHGIPMKYGMGIVRAEGESSIQSITVSDYDDDWLAIPGSEKTLEVDAAAIGYGFVSRNQLSQLFEVQHNYSLMSGLQPEVNSKFQTANEMIYVVGDSAGILGGEGASASGKIAAIDLAYKQKTITTIQANEISKPYEELLRKVKKFRAAFDRIGRRRHGLFSLANAQTVICRCENVTLSQVDDAINQGIKDMTGIKVRTRLGMGDCQGKTCNSYCQDKLKYHFKKEDVGFIKPRFPLELTTFSSLIQEEK